MAKENKATVIRIDGTTEDIGHKPTLAEAHKIVGGYVELVPIRGQGIILVVNEDGMPQDLPINKKASEIFAPYRLFGNIIVLEGWRTL